MPNFRPFLPCILQKMHGNHNFDLSQIKGNRIHCPEKCDRQTDIRTDRQGVFIELLPVAKNYIHHKWRHNECDGVSNHRHLECLLNRLLRRRSKKTSKIRVAGLCAWNPPVTGGFPSSPLLLDTLYYVYGNVSLNMQHHSVKFPHPALKYENDFVTSFQPCVPRKRFNAIVLFIL